MWLTLRVRRVHATFTNVILTMSGGVALFPLIKFSTFHRFTKNISLTLDQYTSDIYDGYHGMSYIISNPHMWTIWSSKGFAIHPCIAEKQGC